MKYATYTTSIQPLLEYFDRHIPLSDHDKQLVEAKFHPRLYRKRQSVLQEGDVCGQFNFVVKGCLRMYKIDDKGNGHIMAEAELLFERQM